MSTEQADIESPRPAARHGAFIPMLLLALTVLGWVGFQTGQLYTGRQNLKDAIAAQNPQIEQSEKLRAAWESLVTRTARLAKGGNPNATVIIDELRKRGLNVNPDTPLPPPPAPPAQ
jgi:hypothetical protein